MYYSGYLWATELQTQDQLLVFWFYSTATLVRFEAVYSVEIEEREYEGIGFPSFLSLPWHLLGEV